MSTTLYSNNAYEQSGANNSSKEFRNRITETNILRDEGRAHCVTVNSEV